MSDDQCEKNPAEHSAARAPCFALIEGVPVVTIPLQDYAALLDFRRQIFEQGVVLQMPFNAASRSPIERDCEVASFFAARLGRNTLANILAECSALYGEARTPSRSALHRYHRRLLNRAPPALTRPCPDSPG